MAVINGDGSDNVLNGTSDPDTITGGAGNDTVTAGDGNDLIIGGDGTLAPTDLVLDWTDQGGNGTDLSGGFTQNTGGINVDVSLTNGGTGTSATVATGAGFVDTGEPFDTTSNLSLIGNGTGTAWTTELEFSAAAGSTFDDSVSNVSFRLQDIDSGGWKDVLTVNAYDADGNLIEVTLTASGDETVDGNTASTGGTANDPDDAQGSVLVEIPGPVARIEIVYENEGVGGQLLYVSDVHFEALPEDDDDLSGGNGNDTILGGFGNDVLDGGGGADSLVGGDGYDSLEGGGGSDTLDGGAANDLLEGDGGRDSLIGGAGSDTLIGGSGFDTLEGGEGNDLLQGGNGNDVIIASGGDTVEGGEGGTDSDDNLIVDDVDFVTFDPTDDENGTVTFNDGSTLTFTGIERLTVNGGPDGVVTGTRENDLIDADFVDENLEQVDNNDGTNGTTGDQDVIEAGQGDDTVFAGQGDDTITGGPATLQSADENLSWISQGDGVNVENGFIQNTGIANITVEVSDDGALDAAEIDNSTQFVDTSEPFDTTSALAIGGNGGPDVATVTVSADVEMENISFRINDVDGDTWQDILTVNAFDADGNPVPVTLTPSGADTVSGQTVTGATGNDSQDIAEGSVLVTIPGPATRFEVVYENGATDGQVIYLTDVHFTAQETDDDLIFGEEGNDVLIGGAGADTLDGGIGNDELQGADDLTGDSLVGGTGDDTIFAGGNDTVDGGEDAGDGDVDILNLTNVASIQFQDGGGANVTGPTEQGVVTFNDGSTLSFSNIEQVNNLDAVPDGYVEGTSGDDVIDAAYTGDPDGDLVDAGDEILPGEGPDDDIILAGDGNDTIEAGASDDEIYGDTATLPAGASGAPGNATGDPWRFEYYDLDPSGSPSNLADAGFTANDGRDNTATPTTTGTTASITPTDFDTANDFALKFTTELYVEEGGSYTFTTTSDDGSKLFVNGEEVVDNDGEHGDETETGTIDLPPGLHTIEVIYFENNGGNTLSGTISGPDTGGSAVDLASYPSLIDPEANTGAGDDVIDGGEGDDLIFGEDGDDSIDGGWGADTIDGGAGNDTLFGEAGDGSADPTVVAVEDFEGGATGWTDNTTTDGGANFTEFLGRFGDSNGAEAVSKTFTTDPTAEVATFQFDFYELDSWDGGGDTFSIFIDGEEVFVDSFDDAGSDSYSTTATLSDGREVTIDVGAGTSTNLGFAGSDDEIHPVTVTVEDPGASITIGFGADLSAGINNESFGIDNLVLTTGQDADNDDVISGGAGEDVIDGGAGADTIDGGDDADTITIGAGDVGDGGEGGDDNDTLIITDAGATVTFDGGNPENGTVTFSDGSTASFTNIENVVVPCFTPGSFVATPHGPVLVEEIQVGDLIDTRDSGAQPVRWIGTKTLSRADLTTAPHLAPIRLRADSIAPGVPARDMTVSPQHRMLIENAATQLWLGEDEVLVKARDMVAKPGVDQTLPKDGVTYIHIMFDAHEIILVDNAWTESFQPGDQTLGQNDFQDLLDLFPELASRHGQKAYRAARLSAKPHEARVILG